MPDDIIREVQRVLSGLPLERKQDIIALIDKYYIPREYLKKYAEEYLPETEDDQKAINRFLTRLLNEEDTYEA